MKKKSKKTSKQSPIKRRELKIEELKALLERVKTVLSPEDYELLAEALETLVFLTRELEAKGASIRRLRKLIFGASTEKTSSVVAESGGEAANGESGSFPETKSMVSGEDSVDAREPGAEQKIKEKVKGHGRNRAAAYHGAKKEAVPHPSLEHGDPCPECPKGKVYRQSKPAVLVRVLGMAPLTATVYELERLRCNLCGTVFTATPPAGVGTAKYDESAVSMIILLKYGCGLPFNRLQRLERSLGIPLPATTQWDIVCQAQELIAPAFEELIRQAAQGEVVHNDDTTMKILELMPKKADSTENSEQRTGVFTSGIVSISGGHKIAMFFTGRQHAGENLAKVLQQRAAELTPPIQMSDALAANSKGDFETILANCLAHARRRFVDVADNFPDECLHVLEALREVYRNDAKTRELKMSPQERLNFHQLHSAPVMLRLQRWLQEQLDEHKVEPNSGLGGAIAYMLKHWQKLTLFLRVERAPLDNNICERIIKKAILHRKAALFYKTQNGARVGDTFMSLILTAELCGANPFDYLVALQRHYQELQRNPGKWMPWNYKDSLEQLNSDSE